MFSPRKPFLLWLTTTFSSSSRANYLLFGLNVAAKENYRLTHRNVLCSFAVTPRWSCRRQHSSRYSSAASPAHSDKRRRKQHVQSNTIIGATTNDDNEIVEKRTRTWLKRIVIGMSLCPFADLKKVKIDVVQTGDDEEILSSILSEMLHRKDAPGTTLMVCPNCYPNNFESYLDVLNIIENGLIKDHQLEGLIQVAPFHPLFQFEGSGDNNSIGGDDEEEEDTTCDEVDNWTNRSPYPLFHILREDEVSRAVDKLDGGDAGIVWKRNVNLLTALANEIGMDNFEKFFRGGTLDKDVKNKVGEVLRQFPVKLDK